MVKSVSENKHIPDTWCLVKHRDVAIINPKIPKDTFDDDHPVSFIPMASVEECSGRYDYSEIRPYKEAKKGYTPFITGDLIFAKITPCMENGKIALLKDLHNNIGFGSTEFHVSRLSELTNKNYFFYFLVRQKTRRDAQRHMTGSSGQLRVPKAYFEELEIPLPPLAEQHRIVDKIEELFSDLDDGIASLKKAQQQLKVYRQAVLKWAFEGKLTAQWREEQKRQGKLESAEVLLEQIKAEREQRYQAELAQWQADVEAWEANGKVGKKPGKPNKINTPKKLPPLSQTELVQIPDNWCWTTLEYLKEFSIYGPRFSSQDYVREGISILRTSDINNSGKVDLKNAPRLALSEKEYQKYKLLKGDLLITRTGSIGTNAIFTSNERAIPGAFLIHYRLLPKVNPEFIFYFLTSSKAKQHFLKKSAGVGRPNLNVQSIEELKIPLPNPKEQEKIVEEIESRLSICDSLEVTITENLDRAEALRQSILKQAFEGKLVPQDPNDEPASVLLERIRQERAKGKGGKDG